MKNILEGFFGGLFVLNKNLINYKPYKNLIFVYWFQNLHLLLKLYSFELKCFVNASFKSSYVQGNGHYC